MNGTGDGNMNRRGKRVIGALPHVDMVIRMNRFFQLETIPARDLNGSVRDHFVDIHVARGSRTGLKHVDGEFRVEFSFNHFLGGGQQGFDLSGR